MPLKSRSTDSSLHSIRCSGRSWEAAKKRAESEGWPMNRAVGELIEGYAEGRINLPDLVRVYEEERAAS